MPPRTDFEFALNTFPTEGLGELRPYYDRLPLDPYIKGKFRCRRFSHYKGKPSKLQQLEHLDFQQSRAVNYVAGGMKRRFEEIEDGVIALKCFHNMVTTFVDFMGIDPTVREIGVHQIRIQSSPEAPGVAAPEGIHQDGFDYVAIFCVERVDIIGPNSHLYRAKDKPPIFNRELLVGEVLLVNDRKVFHFVDPVQTSCEREGHWDVFVLTS